MILRIVTPLFLFAAVLSASAEDEIRSAIRGLVAADNARDLDRAVASYTPDAMLLPPGLAPIHGSAAIRERYRGLYANALPKLEQSIEEVLVTGDKAFVRGRTYGLFPAGPNQPAREIDDKFVMWMERSGGRWRIARLMWNSSRSGTPRQ